VRALQVLIRVLMVPYSFGNLLRHYSRWCAMCVVDWVCAFNVLNQICDIKFKFFKSIPRLWGGVVVGGGGVGWGGVGGCIACLFQHIFLSFDL